MKIMNLSSVFLFLVFVLAYGYEKSYPKTAITTAYQGKTDEKNRSNIEPSNCMVRKYIVHVIIHYI